MEGEKETNKLSKKIVSQGQKKPTPRQKVNQDKIQNYLKTCVTKMKNKQDKLMTQHKFGEKNNKFVLYPERNSFFLFDKDSMKVFFKAKFQIIGTYSEKSKTWRWGWSNRYVPYDLKQTALKIKKFGEANKVEMLSEPKIKNEDMGLIFTALGMELSRSKGYYIIPGTKVYPTIYLIFTQVNKINQKHKDVVAEMRASNRANHKLMRDKLKEPKTSSKSKSKDKRAKLVSKKTKVTTTKKTPTQDKSKNTNKSKSKKKVSETSKSKTTKPKTTKPKKTKKTATLQKKKIPSAYTKPKELNKNTKIHLERSRHVRKEVNNSPNNVSINSDPNNKPINLNEKIFSPTQINENLKKKEILIPVKTRKKLLKS